MGVRGQTPSQTVGPYFSMRLATSDDDAVMAGPDSAGQPITVTGRVLDGDGDLVEDALIEVWQADAEGRYRHPFDEDRPVDPATPGFTGFGRARTGFEDGVWSIRTIKPGRVAGPDGAGLQAPHLNLCVQGRGMLNPVFTRIYFPDEEQANNEDAVLEAVPAGRRDTLVAISPPSPHAGDDAVTAYEFDIRLQGEDETVFLDF